MSIPLGPLLLIVVVGVLAIVGITVAVGWDQEALLSDDEAVLQAWSRGQGEGAAEVVRIARGEGGRGALLDLSGGGRGLVRVLGDRHVCVVLEPSQLRRLQVSGRSLRLAFTDPGQAPLELVLESEEAARRWAAEGEGGGPGMPEVLPEVLQIDVVNLAVPFFIATMLLELVWARWRGGARYEARDTLASLVMGGGNLVEGILTGGAVYALMMAVYVHAPFKLAEQSWGWAPWVFVLGFVADDLRYYWFHRCSHEVRWLWASHVNHHSSQHYNLSTALRQTWSYTLLLGFLFRLPLVLLGFHPAMILFLGGFNLVYQYWIHTELIVRLPRWFEAVFNTPSHHRVHHAINPRYLDSNYAGTLIVWDRLFGTFVPEVEELDPPRYGIVHQLGSFNPLRIALHEILGMFRDATGPGLSLRERLGYLFGPPGYSHDGSRSTSADLKAAHLRRHPEHAGQPGLPTQTAMERPTPAS